MAQSLAVRYRPGTWEEVVSQKSIVRILKRQLQLEDYRHAYLFCGASGCGKTTIAKLFAKSINENDFGTIEIDAASNNGVDNVRTIIEDSRQRAIGAKYKIYIIDECHGLSNQAWQAFLKGIEEPPEYTIYIFCTTDPQKLPATIQNRCQRFNFSRIPANMIESRLNYICEVEHFENYFESTKYISKICSGGMRDAITLLEKAADYSNTLTIEHTISALGAYAYEEFITLANAIVDGDLKCCLQKITDLYESGNDLKLFVEQFLSFNIDIVKYCLFGNCDILNIPATYEQQIKTCVNFDAADKFYMYVVDRLFELKNCIKTDTDLYSSICATIMKVCQCQ